MNKGDYDIWVLNRRKISPKGVGIILMPGTIIECVSKLSRNGPNQFVFTDRRGFPIGYVDTTGVDRDADDRKKQGPIRPSSQVPGNRRDRGRVSHTTSRNWLRYKPQDTHRKGRGTIGTTLRQHNSHSTTTNDQDKYTPSSQLRSAQIFQIKN